MALPNILRNRNGVDLAAFLSSIDARAYAENQAVYGDCTVHDQLGFVTLHRHKQPVQIIVHGDPSLPEDVLADALKNITDNLNVAQEVSA